jgi:serpin B
MIRNHHHRMRALTTVVALAAHHATRTSAQAVDPTEHQAFADDLTAILHAKNANDCTSALGVSMAFSLVWPGCVGEAIGQVRDVLGYPDDGPSSNMRLVWEETTQSMLAGASGQCLSGVWNGVCDSEAPLLKIANAIWYDDGSVLNSTYDSIVGGYAMQTDFEAMESPTVVNSWVENSTNGMIDSIVEEGKPLFPPYVLIAINSIYLKASWSEQFFEWLTNLDIFYDSASRTNTVSEAHFMNMVSYFDYSHDALPEHQVIDMPFDNSQMSMIFVLPFGDGSSGGAVRSTDLIGVLDSLESTRVALSLPKFKFESTYDDIKNALSQLGIVAPFTAGSGALCGMFENIPDCGNLVIDDVIQKTVIDVNEKGVEAAAVTAVMAVATSIGPTEPPPPDPVLMILDHSFQFFIYDKEQGLMLFEGRLGSPEVPDAEPTSPLLDAKHLDADFWANSFGVNPIDPTANMSSTSSNTTATEVGNLSSQETSSPSPKPSDVSSTPSSELSSSQPAVASDLPTSAVPIFETFSPTNVVTRPDEGTATASPTPTVDSSMTPTPTIVPTVGGTNRTLSPTNVVTRPDEEGTVTASPVPTTSPSFPKEEMNTNPSLPQATGNSAPKARLVIAFVSTTGILATLLYLL